MKRKIIFLMTLLVLLLSSCTQASNSEEKDYSMNFSAGWWTFKNSYQNGEYKKTFLIKYDTLKSIERIGSDELDFLKDSDKKASDYEATFGWDVLAQMVSRQDGYFFQKSLDSELPKWCTGEVEEEQQKEPVQKRNNCLIVIESNKSVTINESTTISYTQIQNVYNNDELEFNIIENKNNLSVTTDVSSSYYTVSCNNTGSISYQIVDKTADFSSNIGIITFVESSNNNSNPNFTTSALLVGTWNVSTTGLLFNTIEFYADGTGKTYNPNYQGYNSIKWQIIDTNTMKVTNSLNQSGNVTYNLSVDGTHLTLKDFMGVSWEIEADKA